MQYATRHERMEILFNQKQCEKDQVRKFLKVNNVELLHKTKKLQEWVHTQDLPLQSKDENFLEMMLLRSKFDLEKTKIRTISFFKHIKKYPEFFLHLHSLNLAQESAWAIPGPLVTNQCERVVFLKLNENFLSKEINIDQYLESVMVSGILIFTCDYVASARFILDFKGFTIWHFMKLKLNLLFKLMSIHQKVLKMKVSGIEFLNASGFIGMVVRLAKLVLPQKLYERIMVHDDLESLHQRIGKRYLPQDYGGDLGTFQELAEQWSEKTHKCAGVNQWIASVTDIDS